MLLPCVDRLFFPFSVFPFSLTHVIAPCPPNGDAADHPQPLERLGRLRRRDKVRIPMKTNNLPKERIRIETNGRNGRADIWGRDGLRHMGKRE